MPKPLRNFFWPITDDDTRRQLELFIKLSVVRGVDHYDVLSELVAKYNRSYIAKRGLEGVELVDEKELREKLSEAGTPASRVLLGRYRRAKRLKLARSTIFWTDGRRVVYNLEGCKEFFRLRPAA